jgi:hypothetical protein
MIALNVFVTSVGRKSKMLSEKMPLGRDTDIFLTTVTALLASLAAQALNFLSSFAILH